MFTRNSYSECMALFNSPIKVRLMIYKLSSSKVYNVGVFRSLHPRYGGPWINNFVVTFVKYAIKSKL